MAEIENCNTCQQNATQNYLKMNGSLTTPQNNPHPRPQPSVVHNPVCLETLEQAWKQCMTASITLMLFSCINILLAAFLVVFFPEYASYHLALICTSCSSLQLLVGFMNSLFANTRPTTMQNCSGLLCFNCSVFGCILSLAMILLVSMALSHNTSEYDYLESGAFERHLYAKQQNCRGDCAGYWLMLVFICCGYFTCLSLTVYLANVTRTITQLQNHIKKDYLRGFSNFGRPMVSTLRDISPDYFVYLPRPTSV